VNPWTWPPSVNPEAPIFPGFDPALFDDVVIGALANGGGTFDLPGPAPGFTHRIYEQLAIIPNAIGAGFVAPGISGVYNPSALTAFSGQLTSAGVGSVQPNPIVLEAGETFRLTNGGATGPGVVWAPFYDVNEPTWTAVRMQLTAVAADVIPAPVGAALRKLVFASLIGNGGTRTLNTRNSLYNADTIGHSIEWLLGANLILRSGNIAALLSNTSIPGAPVVSAGSGALRARTAVAIITTPVNLFLIYESQ